MPLDPASLGNIAQAAGDISGSLFGQGGFLDQLFYTKQDRENRNLTSQQIAANQTAAEAQKIRAQADLEKAKRGEVDSIQRYLKYFIAVILILVVIALLIFLVRWIFKGS